MTLPLPWQFGADDPAGVDLESRLQDVFDTVAQQFPVSIGQVSQVPQVRATNSANISIANATNVPLTFDGEAWDTANLHSTVTNTGRLTANIAGLWAINGHVSWAASAAGTYRLASVRLNGTVYIAEQVKSTTGSGQTSIATQYRIAAGDYVELVVNQDSGGALNVVSGSDSPHFAMYWVSP